MKKQYAFVSIFVLAIICLTAGNTFACLCKPLTPKQRAKAMKVDADAIFTGAVLSTTQLSLFTWETTLLAKDSWKGETNGEIKVQSSGGCRTGFVVGSLALVYAKRNTDGVLITSTCWG